MAPLHIHSATVESVVLSQILGSRVFLKLENTQPSGSFKIRGVGHMCSVAASNGASEFVTSSGGNAGMAVAYAGRQLGLPVTVVIPTTTPSFMIDRLKSEGASVIVQGSVWDEANRVALDLVAEKSTRTYIPPFDHELIWEGNASLVDELAKDLPSKPAAIVCVVGGGGLLNGIVHGLRKNAWQDVPVVAVETDGANSFQKAVAAGKLVTLERISSIAKSLGALTVSARSLQLSREHPIHPVVVSDTSTLTACTRFLDDHRFLLEPSCAAALTVVYDQTIKTVLPTLSKDSIVVVVLCGGQLITLPLLEQFKSILDLK